MDISLETPVRFIPRVGPMMAAHLERLGILTAEDLLYHIPFRYDDFSLVSPIARVQPGETVTVSGVVESIKNFYTKTGKKVQEARVTDATGRLTVVWFNQVYLVKIIHVGDTLHLSGNITFFGNKLVMNSPQFEVVSSGNNGPSLNTGRLVPIYSETEGISSKWLRGRVAYLLDSLLPKLTEYLPLPIIQEQQLMGITSALRQIHFPESLEQAQTARHRLAFDELLTLQLRSYDQKMERETTLHAINMDIPHQDVAGFIDSLPFTLTRDQLTTISDIEQDLGKSIPMNRLLEGDVGSGKTVVAAIAMYIAFRNGLQSILMAPTQILAEQHYLTIKALLAPLGISILLQTGNTKMLSKGNKKVSIMIGTHALLAESVSFNNLGLVVIDEQHRFGVTQRSKLLEIDGKGHTPHFLTMTATPIPRTVAKTMFGNLDLSTLNEMPKGRQKVKTWVVPKEKREGAYTWITKQLKEASSQAFIICPLIEESESLVDVKAVTKEYKTLQNIFPSFHLGLLHGRMKPKEKTDTLAKFRDKTYDILVATPVVEVGIDIPNATIMLIEGADRFGLGQLHQLRGRVGRGTLSSYCLLFTESEEELTLKRLKALETIFSGPELAEVDLKLRGPGELFGTRQHGLPNLKVASFTDAATISQTQRLLADLAQHDPQLSMFALLRERVKKSTIKTTIQD